MSALARIEAREAAERVASTGHILEAYDAGLLNDYGGGNIDWWWDYIRAELGRAHEHYAQQVEAAVEDVADVLEQRAQVIRVWTRTNAHRTELEAVLRAAAADLMQFGHLTRETIRRVCRAVTQSAGHQPRSAEQQPAAQIAPGAAGEGDAL